MNDPELLEVIGELKDLGEDMTVTRNVQGKITEIITILNQECSRSISINRALSELEVITDNRNVDSDTRMQLLSVVSMLEGIQFVPM